MGGNKHLGVAGSNISLIPGENEDQRLEQSDSSTPDSPGVSRHKLPTMDPFSAGKEPQGLGKDIAHPTPPTHTQRDVVPEPASSHLCSLLRMTSICL